MSLSAAQLRHEAEQWEAYAKKLREAAKLRDGLATDGAADEAAGKSNGSSNGKSQPGMREEELKRFLQKSAPLTVAQIVSGSGIARGTIRGLLERKKDVFERDRQGRWKLKSSSDGTTAH